MIKGLIFDFDGLILDTETPTYTAWQEIFQQNGCTLEWSHYQLCIGSNSETYSPLADLESLLGHPLDREKILDELNLRTLRLLASQPPSPGVQETLLQARQLGLKLALASSSDLNWVKSNLTRLGLWDFFDCVRTAENVARVKPSPDLFLSAADCLGIATHEAIVFEDSLNGVRAAKSAGMYCVAIPNKLTSNLNLDGADLILPRMDALPLKDLVTAPNRSLSKG